ncbi:hypothetical protein [Vagococcus coleopterorum]|uniref:hypothetical protein n=1 Tax=Vagococcus coleopterorum TaxID=2714946 RepID=UPI003B8341CB
MLKKQLKELDQKIENLQETRKLLDYKITTFDEHLAQFITGQRTADNSEKLWQISL